MNECRRSGDIEIYDSKVVHDLFGNGAKTWTDFFRPRILVIQAAILQDATVLKFTVQHAAGDATGKHAMAKVRSIMLTLRQLSTMPPQLSVKVSTERSKNDPPGLMLITR